MDPLMIKTFAPVTAETNDAVNVPAAPDIGTPTPDPPVRIDSFVTPPVVAEVAPTDSVVTSDIVVMSDLAAAENEVNPTISTDAIITTESEYAEESEKSITIDSTLLVDSEESQNSITPGDFGIQTNAEDTDDSSDSAASMNSVVTAESLLTTEAIQTPNSAEKTEESEISAAIDFNFENEFKFTPLYWAAEKGHYGATLIVLNKGCDVNEINNNGWRALHTAAHGGHKEIVQVLLEYGASTALQTEDDNGWYPLHIAAYHEKIDVVNLLLAEGAITDVKSNNGDTPLYWAVEKNNIEIIKALLRSGCAVNGRNCEDGRTALHHAAMMGHAEAAKIILDHGADPYLLTEDNFNWSPLHVAAYSGNVEIIELYKSRDLNLDIKSKDGRTPLYWATKVGRIESVRALLQAGLNIGRPLNKTVVILADPNATDNIGWRPIHSAAYNDQSNILEFLLKNGADPNLPTQTDFGWTAIHFAACYGKIDIIQQLIDAKVDVNVRAKNGNTALIWAVKKNHINIVAKLLNSGANPYIKNGLGRSAIDIAILSGNKEMVKIIRARK